MQGIKEEIMFGGIGTCSETLIIFLGLRCSLPVGYERTETGLSCRHKGEGTTEELLMNVPSFITIESKLVT